MAISSVSSAPTAGLQATSSLFSGQEARQQSKPAAKAAADGDPPAVEAAESHSTKLSEKNHARVDKLV